MVNKLSQHLDLGTVRIKTFRIGKSKRHWLSIVNFHHHLSQSHGGVCDGVFEVSALRKARHTVFQSYETDTIGTIILRHTILI